MEDLIERARAIEIIHELQDSQTFDQTADMAYDLVDWAISEIPSAQPKSANELAENVQNAPNDDFISRKAAIDALLKEFERDTPKAIRAKLTLENLPSAQPTEASCWGCNCQKMERLKEQKTFSEMVHLHDAETHEERTETHACDLIDRQAAIDAVISLCDNCNPGNCGACLVNFPGMRDCKKVLEELPSAQPESCVDTIDALNESIKHFDDMAEECRRNANIERNDYMDMRDDAAEYRQLSIWLNELKWLRERFQSQPDLSEYSDKLWKAAYERGKAEAQQRWIPCSERLPEQPNPNPELEGKPLDIYLVCKQGNIPFRAFWNGRNFADGWTSLDVDAWMPLPEAYREGES